MSQLCLQLDYQSAVAIMAVFLSDLVSFLGSAIVCGCNYFKVVTGATVKVQPYRVVVYLQDTLQSATGFANRLLQALGMNKYYSLETCESSLGHLQDRQLREFTLSSNRDCVSEVSMEQQRLRLSRQNIVDLVVCVWVARWFRFVFKFFYYCIWFVWGRV